MKFSTFNSTWNLFLDIAVEAAEAQDNFVGFFDDPCGFRNYSELLGCGMYSSVYGSAHENYVIKECNKLFTDGWLYYALDCLVLGDNRKPWMPEVKLLLIDEKMGRYHAVVERLSTCCSSLVPWIQEGLDDMDSLHI